MMLTEHNPKIKSDLIDLIRDDSVFSKYVSDYTQADRHKGRDGMDGLIDIMVGQQVSTKAADSMREKFHAKFGLSDPYSILQASDDDFRSCGLSRQKITYVRGLADAMVNGQLDFDRWENESTDVVTNEIMALKGFGLWSAQMYLMFNLCRADVWPYGDLGIQKGLQKYMGLDDKLSEVVTKATGESFKGCETAASLLLWQVKDS